MNIQRMSELERSLEHEMLELKKNKKPYSLGTSVLEIRRNMGNNLLQITHHISSSITSRTQGSQLSDQGSLWKLCQDTKNILPCFSKPTKSFT